MPKLRGANDAQAACHIQMFKLWLRGLVGATWQAGRRKGSYVQVLQGKSTAHHL